MITKELKSLKSYKKKIAKCEKILELKRKLKEKEVEELIDIYGAKAVKNFYMQGIVDIPMKILQYVIDAEKKEEL